MKVTQARVQNFRSIVDSGIVDIEERITVLVGKNEQGKTNFLKALSSFNKNKVYTASDLPSHLAPTIEMKKPADVPMVTLWLTADRSEMTELKGIIPTIESVRTFKATRFYDGHYEYSIIDGSGVESKLEIARPDIKHLVLDMTKEAESLRAKLDAHAKRLPAFAPGFAAANEHIDHFVKANFEDFAQIENLVRTLIAALNSVPGQDQAIQDDIGATNATMQTKQSEIQKVLERNTMSTFELRLPIVMLHISTIDKIPNDVPMAEFIANPEATSKGMANLCLATGVTTQSLKDLAASADVPQVERYEDYYRRSISGGINEFWKQATYIVYFRIQREKLSVSISDNVYSSRIPPLERSDGFQWYLSFYCVVWSEVSSPKQPIVVLLDNPGLELHPDGQRDIKKFLEEKVAQKAQIVYVTHSPAMIDPHNLEQVRKVEFLGEAGTTVQRFSAKIDNSTDLLEPIRSAIGARLVSSLALNHFNILIEGAADKPLLEGAFARLRPDVADRILINGSIAETNELLPQFYERSGLPMAICLDADSSGRKVAESLEKAGVSKEKILQIRSVFTPSDLGFEERDFEIEDVLSADFYHDAVSETYPKHNVAKPKDSKVKRTNYYETAFKTTLNIGFTKRRVAETVKKMLLDGKGDGETLDRLKKLTTALLDILESQTTKKTVDVKKTNV